MLTNTLEYGNIYSDRENLQKWKERDNMTYEQIMETLEGMNTKELVEIHNKYCDAYNDMDNVIYENDDYFLETYFMERPAELARSIQYGDYRYSDDYVQFDGYGNLDSFNYTDGHVFLSDIANYVADLDEDEQEDFLDV